jgi:hypothetical protein
MTEYARLRDAWRLAYRTKRKETMLMSKTKTTYRVIVSSVAA